jgi:phosphopantothenoylcysteine synthetase/decarboxylase
MRLLVTAGNTLIPIDQVRCITNVFTGRTGTRIALHAHHRGHAVVLLTSHPELVAQLRNAVEFSSCSQEGPGGSDRGTLHVYKTFDDLERRLEECICNGDLDGVIHCAAVSDYRPAGIYTRDEGRGARGEGSETETSSSLAPRLSPLAPHQAAGKIKSDEPELWLRLVRTPKLIDRIRNDWQFTGILVKFKLEVDVSEQSLLEIAEVSRRQSGADLMVANALETASTLAYLGPIAGSYQRVDRNQLPERLLEAVETLQRERKHG